MSTDLHCPAHAPFNAHANESVEALLTAFRAEPNDAFSFSFVITRTGPGTATLIIALAGAIARLGKVEAEIEALESQLRSHS